MRLFGCRYSRSIATLEALHAEVCVEAHGYESDSLDSYWHLLGNCGYTRSRPESTLNGSSADCNPAAYQYGGVLWGKYT